MCPRIAAIGVATRRAKAAARTMSPGFSNARMPPAWRPMNHAARTASSVLPAAIAVDGTIGAGCGEVDEEGPDEHGGPEAEAIKKQRRDCDAGWRPDRAGVRVDERKRKPDAAGDEVDAGNCRQPQ